MGLHFDVASLAVVFVRCRFIGSGLVGVGFIGSGFGDDGFDSICWGMQNQVLWKLVLLRLACWLVGSLVVGL